MKCCSVGALELWGAAPNPFAGLTHITFGVPADLPAAAGGVRLDVYDVSGRLVRRLIEGGRRTGLHTITWDGRDDGGAVVAPGVYVSRLADSRSARTLKMVLSP